MPFSKPLPEWNNQGTAPTVQKKNEGWKPKEKPPAGVWNWQMYTAYQALSELQKYAIHSDTLGKPNGIATLNENSKMSATQLDSASLLAKGIVKLNSAIDSTSETEAATPKAVKDAYDIGNKKYLKPTNGIPKADLEQAVKDTLDNVVLKVDKGAVSGVASLDAKKRVQQEQAVYSVYKTNKDTNGIYTTVEFKRPDGTLSKRSVLTNADVNGNYQTQTISYFDTNGTTSLGNDVFTITYDSDGNVINEVLQ